MGYCLEVSYATRNKGGRKNQDNFMVDRYVSCSSSVSECCGYLKTDTSEVRLMAVSDGVGGGAKGEIASMLTVTALSDHLENIKNENSEIALFNALDDANNRVVSFFEKLGVLGAATLSGLLFTEDNVMVFNAGDSPVYLISDGVLELISQEHTLAGNSSNRKSSIDENTITRYMGNKSVSGSETVYSGVISLTSGMTFIISSDGIEKGLKENKIKRLSSKNDEFAAGTLVEAAYKHGAADDTTAIVIKVSSDENVSEGETE